MLGTIARMMQAADTRDRAALAQELRSLADALDPDGQGQDQGDQDDQARSASEPGEGQGGHEDQVASQGRRLVGQALCDAIMSAYDQALGDGQDESEAIRKAAVAVEVTEGVAKYHVQVGHKQRRQAWRDRRNRRAYELAIDGLSNRAIADALRHEGFGQVSSSSVTRFVREQQRLVQAGTREVAS